MFTSEAIVSTMAKRLSTSHRPSSLPYFFPVSIEKVNFTYHIKPHCLWVLTPPPPPPHLSKGTDFALLYVLQAPCEMSYPQTQHNTTSEVSQGKVPEQT